MERQILLQTRSSYIISDLSIKQKYEHQLYPLKTKKQKKINFMMVVLWQTFIAPLQIWELEGQQICPVDTISPYLFLLSKFIKTACISTLCICIGLP